MELKIETVFGDTITCISFYDIDNDYSGYDLYRDDQRLGSIIYECLDSDDEESLADFKDEVETWLVDNEY